MLAFLLILTKIFAIAHIDLEVFYENIVPDTMNDKYKFTLNLFLDQLNYKISELGIKVRLLNLYSFEQYKKNKKFQELVNLSGREDKASDRINFINRTSTINTIVLLNSINKTETRKENNDCRSIVVKYVRNNINIRDENNDYLIDGLNTLLGSIFGFKVSILDPDAIYSKLADGNNLEQIKNCSRVTTQSKSDNKSPEIEKLNIKKYNKTEIDTKGSLDPQKNLSSYSVASDIENISKLKNYLKRKNDQKMKKSFKTNKEKPASNFKLNIMKKNEDYSSNPDNSYAESDNDSDKVFLTKKKSFRDGLSYGFIN